MEEKNAIETVVQAERTEQECTQGKKKFGEAVKGLAGTVMVRLTLKMLF